MRKPSFDTSKEGYVYSVRIAPHGGKCAGPFDDYMDALVAGLKAEERTSSELYIMREKKND